MQARRFAVGILLFVLASVILEGAGISQVQPAEVGDTAPDFTLIDLDGNEVTLSDHFGKVIVLSFLGACGECLYKQVPTLQEQVYEVYSREDVEILVVNMSASTIREELLAVREEFGIEFPILLNGDDLKGLMTAANYGIFAAPDLILIGRDGNIRHKETRKIFDEETRVILEQLIAELQAPQIGGEVGMKAPDFTLTGIQFNAGVRQDELEINLYEALAANDVMFLYFYFSAS